INAAKDVYKITAQDRVYQGFSLTFDASIEEIWLTFAAGATLVPALSEEIRAGAGLVEFLNARQITVFSCVPTLLAMLDVEIPSLRLLILGGEVCPYDLIVHWSRPNLRIINTYGPTETCVVATYAECQPNRDVLLGKPLSHCEIEVLNVESLQH